MFAPRDQRAANRRYYATNREREIRRVRQRQGATLAFLRQIRDVPCIDCGGMFAPHQMDFDHRDPSLKSFRLTEGRAMLKARPDITVEVRKCDVVCANCHRIRTQATHAARVEAAVSVGKSRYLDRKRAVWRQQARLLNELRQAPCRDCGRRFPPCAMDFDHRDPAAKVKTVTRMIGRAGTARILAEVRKCDIVCANCHRARTIRRRSELVVGRE
jgi:predicted Zn-ribbon and HTH transcriptional regulator